MKVALKTPAWWWWGCVSLIMILNTNLCTGCGFTRTLSDANPLVITSPNYPSNYPNRASCTWNIRSTSEYSKLTTSFTYFSTESGYDKVYLDGTQYSGTSRPSTRITFGLIQIRFTSDGSVTRRGFSLTVRASRTVCGGLVSIQSNEITKNLQYPPTPAITEPVTSCIWVIRDSLSRSFKVRISAFNMRQSYGVCYGSTLTYRTGTSTYNNNMCYRSVGYVWYTTALRVDLTIRSASTLGTKGFTLLLTPCGFAENITSPKTLTSPNYPGNYYSNANCKWIIGLPANSTYRYLQVRTTYFYTQSYYDKLYVATFNYLSGSRSQTTFYPPGRSVEIRFTSNSNSNYRGFSLTVTPTNTAPPCGGAVSIPPSGAESTFAHPPASNPNPSPNECIFEVSSALGISFDLILEAFSMKTSTYSCGGPYLYVKYFLSYTTTENQICSYSYRVNHKFTSTAKAIIRLRRNNRNLYGRGFRFRYKPCGFVKNLTSSTNTVLLKTLRHPSNYPGGITCKWRVSAPPSSTTHRWLKVQATYFRTQTNNDPVYIEDYPRISGLKSITTANPLIWYSIGSTVHVNFTSDRYTHYQGISLTVSAITMEDMCRSSMQQSASVESATVPLILRSPRYPNKYPADSNCTWNVSVPASQTTHRWLRVTADSLDLRDDFLQIDNYTAVTGNISTQRVWHSWGPFVIIRFNSNAFNHGQGFNLNIAASNEPPVACGGQIDVPETQDEGRIQWSPSSTDESVALCQWDISAQRNRSVGLDLEQFSLRNNSDAETCNGTIFNVQSRTLLNSVNSSVDSHQLCDNTSYAAGWYTPGQEHVVRFESAVPQFRGRGFRMKYKACGYSPVFTNTSETLVLNSPRYPNEYPANTRCFWNITGLHPVYRLMITVHNVSLNSSNDFLEIENATFISNITSTFSSEYTPSKLNIRFRSDGMNASSGFNITVGARYKRCDEHGCSHNCSIINNVPVCACPNNHGWTMGADNKTCSDINECAPTHRNVCHGFVQCVNTMGGFLCNCTNGYKLNANRTHCVDRDGGWTPWTPWSACTYGCGGGQRQATRNCTQPTVQGNGIQCLKLDNTTRALAETRTENCNMQRCQTCAEYRCSHSCNIVRRMPTCSCPSTTAWRLDSDSKTCLDINECAAGRPAVCHGFATCINSVGSYRCNCTDGYKLSSDRRSCIDRDGDWDEWTDWSTCSESCQHSAKRNCSSPTPVREGLLCMRTGNSTRSMNETRVERCTGGSCPSGGSSAGAVVGALFGLGVVGAAGGVLFKLKSKKVAPS